MPRTCGTNGVWLPREPPTISTAWTATGCARNRASSGPALRKTTPEQTCAMFAGTTRLCLPTIRTSSFLRQARRQAHHLHASGQGRGGRTRCRISAVPYLNACYRPLAHRYHDGQSARTAQGQSFGICGNQRKRTPQSSASSTAKTWCLKPAVTKWNCPPA